jgi:hypothetical protein
MEQEIEEISSVEQEEVPLIPWTEYVGKVVNVTESNITLEVIQHISIPISADSRNKWKSLVQEGKHVAILAFDDGTIRIRSLASC